jgi:hypothetical protein
MDSFDIFFEKRERNRLRKQELKDSGVINNKEWVDQEKKNLPPVELEKIKKMEELQVPPELIDKFKEGKLKEHGKKLSSEYLIGKENKDLVFRRNYRNVKIYTDPYVVNVEKSVKRTFSTVFTMMTTLKDIIPTRGFSVIVTNSERNPNFPKVKSLGDGSKALAYYMRNKIYVDELDPIDASTLLHEYAHLLADRVPKNVERMIRREYEKMINDYFTSITGKRSRRKNLEGKRNAINREKVAKALGLPSDYAATNFDEWFAVLIEHWKQMKNNMHTYEFKKILKKVIIRL